MCESEIMPGTCQQTIPRWAFDVGVNDCVPFYYSGCEGNLNNFLTREQCKRTCPNTRASHLQIQNKTISAQVGETVLINVNIG